MQKGVNLQRGIKITALAIEENVRCKEYGPQDSTACIINLRWRLREYGHTKADHQNRKQCRQYSANSTVIEIKNIKLVLFHRIVDVPGNQKTGNDKKNINPGKPAVKGMLKSIMEENNRKNCKRAQAVNITSVTHHTAFIYPIHT
ncbi:hypothetical protein HNR55_002254 [Acetobacter lovaniensis]|uniref:Uncharacterized protein n=1 Tax=Acetobacter lovaniensis TaxID=104100 RepID=A0A841QGW8_9PROT|nr:hypothetical protein [Acetobacter lovaniensis]